MHAQTKIKYISNLPVYETSCGAIIPLPILQYLSSFIPMKYIISIADKVRFYKWITLKGRIHIDAYPYRCDFDPVTKTYEIVLETNKYKFIATELGKFFLILRRRPNGSLRKIAEYKLDKKAIRMLVALIKVNEVLREREIDEFLKPKITVVLQKDNIVTITRKSREDILYEFAMDARSHGLEFVFRREGNVYYFEDSLGFYAYVYECKEEFTKCYDKCRETSAYLYHECVKNCINQYCIQ